MKSINEKYQSAINGHEFPRKIVNPAVGARIIAINVSACLHVYLSVCLSVFRSNILKKLHVRISPNFLYMLLWHKLYSVFLRRQCNTLCTLSEWARIKDDVFVSQVAAPRAMYAASDCILHLLRDLLIITDVGDANT